MNESSRSSLRLRLAVRSRKRGSSLMRGIATALPVSMTRPVMPSPSLYFTRSIADREIPWATSMLISLRNGSSRVMVPRTMFMALERMSRTLYKDALEIQVLVERLGDLVQQG